MDPLDGGLNPEQRRAVQTTQGPLLILAGAGSGKTRVITCRIAHLLRQGAPQSAILAVTFTNKAAQEMAQRVRAMHGRRLPNLTLCTFHAFGVKVLRRHGQHLGYRSNFSIYDETDRQSLIKEAARDLGLIRREADHSLDPYALGTLFSRLKSGTVEWNEGSEPYRGLFAEYENRLRLFNAVDFDDLILLPLRLMESHPEVLAALRERYRYFMVDEFQDSSQLQYRLVSSLAERSRNLCVVGDDDQSIYSWRGAHFENILQFEQDFPEFAEIKLEQNYRSTRRILAAANQLIHHNRNRKGKRLWSGLPEGDPIILCFPEHELREGELIAARIRSLALRQRLPHGEVAVLVRTNALTRAIEEAFVRENLPYRVSGGMSFFQRKEVKDILSYLRLAANPDDDVSLLRVINTPRRGIGKKTLEALVQTARRQGCSLYSAGVLLAEAEPSPGEKAYGPLQEFLQLLQRYRAELLGGKKMAPILSRLVEEIDYWGHLVQEHPNGMAARFKYGNVEGVVDSLASYEEDPDVVEPGLFDYLNRIGLLTREERDEGNGAQRVNLMTIHAAKGLEFDTVFIAGLERGLLPHARSLEQGEGELEEERRLFYVAMTRARRRLVLSACRTRRRRGLVQPCEPSPFLEELPADLLEVLEEEPELPEGEARRLFAEMRRRLS
jgi:DNA helicase-2/ATP-dependent DNA helicase PcrA